MLISTEGKYILGYDPGKTGGLAIINYSSELIATFKMPDTSFELLALVTSIKTEFPNSICYVEDVGPNSFTKASYLLGYSRAQIEVATASNNIRMELVKARKWQTELKCLTGGDKNVTKKTAMRLFPDEKVTHSTADAILIAEYGRKSELLMLAAQAN